MRQRLFLFAALPLLALLHSPALAQRAAENATEQSSDAFGRQVGPERTGIYTIDDVRGFNPVDAGNARIEGFYFDQIALIPMRITDGNTVRVGIAAQGYLFPAPTGLADHDMTVPGGDASASFEIDTGQFGGPGASVEIKLPVLGERLALSLGTGGRNMQRPEGGDGKVRNWGATVVARPGADTELLVFYGGFRLRGEEVRATLFPAGLFEPPRPERRKFLGQQWTQRENFGETTGAIARVPLGGIKLEAGLFLSRREQDRIYADLVTQVATDGSAARRVIIADGNAHDQSLSGEVRAVRSWASDGMTHTVTASLRGRHKQRNFGGSQSILLGASSALVPDFRAAPAITLGAKNHDDTRQTGIGLAYSLAWAEVGSLDLGAIKTRYRKRIDFADVLLPDVRSAASPVLWNAMATIRVMRTLTLYAGTSRGMEEALIAPDIASNRSEAPPAIRTSQVEAGLRYAVTRNIGLVAGGFSITKPYFNLDPQARYRELGKLVNRGIELSISGELAPGLRLVGGTILLDPHIKGEAVDNGLIGPRPVGQVRRRTVANLDWRLGAGKGAFSFDLGVESLSSRFANAANTLTAPARTTVNLGARYRFEMAGAKLLLRPRIENLFNEYGWLVSSSGGWTYTSGRTGLIQLVADI